MKVTDPPGLLLAGQLELRGLQREVIKRTGKGIETFQGKYSETSFIDGGR